MTSPSRQTKESAQEQPNDGPAAIVTYASVKRLLRPGQSLTFGRGHGHDIGIGQQPPDLRVPRFAGRLECRDDGVLIHNTSDKRTITMRTFPGPVLEIAPQTLIGTVPHHMVQLVLNGQSGSQYAINIDTRGLNDSAAAHSTPSSTSSTANSPINDATIGYTRIVDLRTRERHLLIALCLPAWTGQAARDEVPSYTELEHIFRSRGVAVGAKRLRNDLDALRRKLAEDHHVEGVHAPTTGPDQINQTSTAGGKHSYLPTLAHWARASGNVTDEELERFDDGDLRP